MKFLKVGRNSGSYRNFKYKINVCFSIKLLKLLILLYLLLLHFYSLIFDSIDLFIKTANKYFIIKFLKNESTVIEFKPRINSSVIEDENDGDISGYYHVS